MNVIVPYNISNMIKAALVKSGSREIGGILLGEHTKDNEFQICDITIQKTGGDIAFFERLVNHIIAPLKNFFDRTGHNYKRFNYLGEWHSHPNFSLFPSLVDHSTMQELIGDEKFGANFIVLMIIKLERGELNGSVTIYQSNKEPYRGNLVFSEPQILR